VWLPNRTVTAPVVIMPTPAGLEAIGQSSRAALVVEDDEQSANLIRVQLEAEGFTVVLAHSAEAALILAQQQTFSLITLDVLLPNMDGWEFLSQIKALPTLEQIPVVIISMFADRNKGFALGAASVVQKPVSRETFFATLGELGLLERGPTHALSVLVVDDDPNAVELIAVRLEGVATRVTRAFGGRDAIAAVQAERPDLIVLDLMMPEMNGFEVIDALNADPATAGIPVIVVTAKRITVGDRERLSQSVTAIMEKGQFNREHLTREVRRAMSGRHGAA